MVISYETLLTPLRRPRRMQIIFAVFATRACDVRGRPIRILPTATRDSQSKQHAHAPSVGANDVSRALTRVGHAAISSVATLNGVLEVLALANGSGLPSQARSGISLAEIRTRFNPISLEGLCPC